MFTKLFKGKQCHGKGTITRTIDKLFNKSSEKLTVEQACSLYELLTENSDLFADSPSHLGKTTVVEHTIDTGTTKPIKQRADHQ